MTKKIDKDVVCMMPWIHMHIWPDGNVFPCCMADSSVSFGNTNEQPFDEIINNEYFKNIRQKMLNGEKPDVCSRCYELEESASSWTLRKNSLDWFYDDHKHKLENTNEDGSLNEFTMNYMDIRFSNLCNMRCRTCGPGLSSSWYEDQYELYGDPGHPKFLDVSDREDFMDQLRNHLDHVEEVYFAGGEALVTPQHYEVLNYWLKNNQTDVRLRYTTNFSVLRYKKKHIFDYWNSFNNVIVAASLDATGPRAEYMRKGTIWDNIIKNRQEMIKNCPDVHFEITPTVSLFNGKHLYDFHRSWVEHGLLDINNIRVNILTFPQEYSLTILDEKEKEKVRRLYNDYIKWLEDNGARDDVIGSVKGVIQYMDSKDDSNLKGKFKRRTQMVDGHRRENFIKTFPELKEWYER